MKGIVISMLLAVIACNSTLDFLELGATGDITITVDCEGGYKFKHSRYKVSPTTVQKGKPINIVALGNLLEQATITGIKVVAYLNGVESFTDSKSYTQITLPAGAPYTYTYNVNVPSFVPTGTFEANLYLVNDQSKTISCLKASFEYVN